MIKKLLYGFKRKIFLGISLIMISVMTLLSILYFFSVKAALTRNQEQNLNNINRILVNSIDTCIMDMKNAIFYITANDDLPVLTIPEYFGSNEFFASQKAFEVLLTSFGKSRDFDSIYLFVPENGMVISQNSYDSVWASTPEAVRDLEAYKQISGMKEDLGVLSSVTKVSYYNADIFGVYYKITDDIFIEVTMDKEFFDNILRDVYGQYFEHIIITDSDGRLVFTNDREFNDAFDKLKTAGLDESVSNIDVGDNSYLLSREYSEQSGWVVTAFTNNAVIIASTLEMIRIMVLITGVAVVGILAFSYMLSLTLSVNARKLAATMKKAPASNYAVIERISSNDEFGEISDSFIEMMKELVNNKLYAKDMQIRVLQQQINPHFLYNTFDVLSYFIMNDQKDTAIEMLERLSDMFRYNVYSNDQYMTRIGNEVNNLRNYLYILKMRMGDILKVTWDIDKEIYAYMTPKFILQPVVENSIKHAFKEHAKTQMITVKAYKQDVIIFEISDNGIGLQPERLDEVRKALADNSTDSSSEFGIGLLNINSRIRLEFGSEYGVSIESEHNVGTRVIIRIPLVED